MSESEVKISSSSDTPETKPTQTHQGKLHEFSNWLNHNWKLLLLLATFASGIWYISDAYTHINTSITNINTSIDDLQEEGRENNKGINASIESLQSEGRSNNEKINENIKRIDKRLDGMDRRLSTIEGKISNLSEGKNAPKKTAHPISH